MNKWATAIIAFAVSMTLGGALAIGHERSATPGALTPGAPDPAIAAGREAGVDVELEGTLEVFYEDRLDGSRVQHVLSTDDGRRIPIEAVAEGHDLVTGDRVAIRGRRVQHAVRLDGPSAAGSRGAASTERAALRVLAMAPLSNTLGPQKAVLLLVNFTNDPSQPYTVDYARSVMSSVSDLLAESSYGQLSLTADVFGWYTIPMTNASCDMSKIRSLAQQAAIAHGVDLSRYARQLYAFPFNSSCTFAGFGSIGGSPSSAWLNGQIFPSHVAHELGHNLGLYHSHALSCSGATLGSACGAIEYGDAFDPMGNGPGHYNAFQKDRLGWLRSGSAALVTDVESSGTYSVAAYETPGVASKALRIPRGTTGQSFYVELRRKLGWDAGLLRTGVIVHLVSDSDPNSSQLLDMAPATSSFGDDAFLDAGKTFSDPVSGITIATTSLGATDATVSVAVGADCRRSAPSLTATPARSHDVSPGTTVTYTVSVTNQDSPACSPSTFALQAAGPSGWQQAFAVPSVSVGPGATVTTSLQVTSPSVQPGAYTIAGTATHSADPSLSGSAAVVYVVGDVIALPGPFTDRFDRPDSPVLGNGWSPVAGSLQVKAGESRNPANAIANVAVQPAIAGSTQAVSAAFASTNNNASPRFGVIVRYRDPQNYYACYRQIGGSSLVRIAKVQNGVETILKSAAIGNPAVNAFSTLSCQASGSTLTLKVDGVTKLTAADLTFGSGAVGYSISARLTGAHRADNFTAVVQ